MAIHQLKINLKAANPYRKALIFIVPIGIFVTVLVLGRIAEGSQQFSELAKAFLHGQTNFLKPIGSFGQDPIYWNGKIYWGEGPLPAILLIPFVAIFSIFHLFFYQGYIDWLLILGVFYFVYKLARILLYSLEDSLILAFGFVLGSVFIGVSVVSSSWLFAQVLTTFLLFWSLYEYLTRKRWWLIGLICGAIFLTRVTASPVIIFFLLELWRDNKARVNRMRYLVSLVLPALGAIVLIGLYNVVRFGDPLNGGYGYQLLYRDSSISRSYGIFSLIHVPANLYSLLLRAPLTPLKANGSWTLKFPYIESNPLGMSMFITSPYLLYFFTQKWSIFDKRCKNLMIAIACSAALVLTFYGIGIDQFGYRYSLDFLPEIFLLLMIVYRKNHKNLTRGMKTLLLGAGIVNFYMIWSYLVLP